MARRVEVDSSDIAEPQIIVAYPDDQFVTWHGRVLLRPLGQPSWIWSTPDREVQDANGASVFCRGLTPIVSAELQAEWLHVERFEGRELTTWKAAKAAVPGRDRPAAPMLGSGGRRFLPLAEALDLSRPLDLDAIKDWWIVRRQARWIHFATPCTSWSQARTSVAPHTGPGASVVVLRDVRGMGRELITYHDPRLAAAGLHLDAPHQYEHSLLCSVLGPMDDVDQLDLAKCALAELLSRQLVQLERAVRACPRPPNFTGQGARFEMNWAGRRCLFTDEFTGRFAAVADADIRDTMQTRLLQDDLRQTNSEEIDADDSPAAGGRRCRRKNA